MSDEPAPQRERVMHLLAAEQCTTSTHCDGATHTLCLYGELDLAAEERVQAELQRIEASGARSIVIDLSGVTFMDSTGIQLMLRARARARANTRHLVLRPGPAAVQRVLEISGVSELLSFAD